MEALIVATTVPGGTNRPGIAGFTVLAAAVRRMTEEQDPAAGEKVDGAPGNVADSVPC